MPASTGPDIRSVFLASDRAYAEARLREIAAPYTPIAPKLATWMEENLPQGLMAASAATLRVVFQTVYLAPLDSPSSSCRLPARRLTHPHFTE